MTKILQIYEKVPIRQKKMENHKSIYCAKRTKYNNLSCVKYIKCKKEVKNELRKFGQCVSINIVHRKRYRKRYQTIG